MTAAEERDAWTDGAHAMRNAVETMLLRYGYDHDDLSHETLRALGDVLNHVRALPLPRPMVRD